METFAILGLCPVSSGERKREGKKRTTAQATEENGKRAARIGKN